MEEGLPPIAAMKDDSRQSDSDTEQQHDYYNSSNVEELRTRLRERDEQLVTLKDDKAGCMRQILDLKDQLYQLVSRRSRLNACMMMIYCRWSRITQLIIYVFSVHFHLIICIHILTN